MGKVLAAMIVLSALAAGGAMYYFQVYGYYTEVTASGVDLPDHAPTRQRAVHDRFDRSRILGLPFLLKLVQTGRPFSIT